jgi:hypothetical protein
MMGVSREFGQSLRSVLVWMVVVVGIRAVHRIVLGVDPTVVSAEGLGV